MSSMPSPYPQLGERMTIPTTWEEYFNLSKHHLIEKESHTNTNKDHS